MASLRNYLLQKKFHDRGNVTETQGHLNISTQLLKVNPFVLSSSALPMKALSKHDRMYLIVNGGQKGLPSHLAKAKLPYGLFAQRY
jgi:hypothetical protein